MTDPASSAVPPAPVDPVLVKRAKIAALVKLGKQIGYGLFGYAVVVFFVALFGTGFGGFWGTSIIVALLVGSVLLIPAIVFGYGIKAAEREERGGGSFH